MKSPAAYDRSSRDKTIMILLPIGLTIRNLISSGTVSKLLAKPSVRVVLVTNESPDLIYHLTGTRDIKILSFPIQSRLTPARLLHRSLRARFDRIHNIPTFQINSKTMKRDQPLGFLFESLISQPFPRSQKTFRLLQSMDQWIGGIPSSVQEIFDQFQPSMVVSTNPTRMTEYSFLKQARLLNIKTVGIIKSWDVILTKGYIPVPLDYYLVWTQVMKNDFLKFNSISETRVGVTGIPQFDVYAETVESPDRREFFRIHGLDPDKKTILFSTSTSWIGIEEPQILRHLIETIGNRYKNSIQILVRLHPMDDPSRYQDIRHPNLVYQLPAERSDQSQEHRYLDPLYLTKLRDALLYSDVVINTASTMSLDAVALDKPVINLAFDLNPTPYFKSSRRFYEFDHYLPIVQSGAVRIAGSFSDLIELIHQYLENPDLDASERAHLRKTMCHKIDGQSSERMANFLFSILEGQGINRPVLQHNTRDPVANSVGSMSISDSAVD